MCCFGDAAVILGQLLHEIGARGAAARGSEAERRVAAHRERHGYFDDRAYFADDKPILPQRVIGELQRSLPENAIVTCDAGENRIMMTHFYQTKRAEGFLQAAGSGPMGFAIPAALGAKLVHPDRPVVAVCGDGGFAMTMNGLMTAVEQRHPDHRASSSTTTRWAGCCTARGRSPPSSTIWITPRSPARWAAAGCGSRSRRRSAAGPARGARRADADRARRAHLAHCCHLCRHHLAAGEGRVAAAALRSAR